MATQGEVSLGKVNERLDHMATKSDISRLDGRFGPIEERLDHMPTKADMGSSLFKQYLAVFGALITSTLGLAAIMAKGFGWL